MTTPIRTAKALEWALKEGLDNSQVCIYLNEVDPTFTYGTQNISKDVPPHVAIYFPPSETDFLPVTPDHVGYVYDNNELIHIIFFFDL